VSFPLPKGHLLGLIGENGAGKTTLTNVLGGVLAPDSGMMKLRSADYAPRRPAEATAAGIAFIHQELNLFPNLSIADNLFIDRFPRLGKSPFINKRGTRQTASCWNAEPQLPRLVTADAENANWWRSPRPLVPGSRSSSSMNRRLP
jgi:ABC-type sugar transport system ATPase subunit